MLQINVTKHTHSCIERFRVSSLAVNSCCRRVNRFLLNTLVAAFWASACLEQNIIHHVIKWLKKTVEVDFTLWVFVNSSNNKDAGSWNELYVLTRSQMSNIRKTYLNYSITHAASIFTGWDVFQWLVYKGVTQLLQINRLGICEEVVYNKWLVIFKCLACRPKLMACYFKTLPMHFNELSDEVR